MEDNILYVKVGLIMSWHKSLSKVFVSYIKINLFQLSMIFRKQNWMNTEMYVIYHYETVIFVMDFLIFVIKNVLLIQIYYKYIYIHIY